MKSDIKDLSNRIDQNFEMIDRNFKTMDQNFEAMVQNFSQNFKRMYKKIDFATRCIVVIDLLDYYKKKYDADEEQSPEAVKAWVSAVKTIHLKRSTTDWYDIESDGPAD